MDKLRIERAVKEILLAIGEDPGREGLVGTPRRVAEAYEMLFAGLEEDPVQHLEVGFQENHREMVLIRDIPLHSLCEHHLLPMVGKAHVGYIPDGKVVGLSKLARLVEGYARRPPASGTFHDPDRRRPARGVGGFWRHRGDRSQPS